MVARIFTFIAIGGIVSGSPLSYWEQKLVGSWQIDLPSGERLVETYEPDRSYWTLFVISNQTSPGVTAKWSLDHDGKLLTLDDVRYASSADGRPPKYAIHINGIGEHTLNLAGLTFTRCQRPKRPAKPISSSPSPSEPSNQALEPTAGRRTERLKDEV